MLAASVARPLAGGSRVVVSAWRDIQEGARAHLLQLPGICRVDARPLADSLAIRYAADAGVILQELQAGEIQSVEFDAGGADVRDARQFGLLHIAFRAETANRTVDVSLIIGIIQLQDDGIARVSVQAVLVDAGR